MSENTRIEWCDHTFNPWEGCQKVGPGCDHCYAETRNARFGGGTAVNWGPGAPRRRTSAANWRKPLHWNAEAYYACATCKWRGGLMEVSSTGGSFAVALCPACGDGVNLARQRVFCASLADVFDNQVDPQWREDLFKLIEATPNLDWLLLTKRVGNVLGMLPIHWMTQPPRPTNVRIGATIVNQEEADRDIPKLLMLNFPNFLSMEPLLGLVDLNYTRQLLQAQRSQLARAINGETWIDWVIVGETWIDWVIVGGESGPGARPMHPDWARGLRDQCAAAGVPFLFKQWGEWVSVSEGAGPGEHHHFPDGATVRRVGKKLAGRALDGITHDGYPS